MSTTYYVGDSRHLNPAELERVYKFDLPTALICTIHNAGKGRHSVIFYMKPEEIELYSPFLDRQIEIIQPKVVATLGRFSGAYIMNKFGLGSELSSISKIHGKEFSTDTSFGKLTIVPLFHPAVALYDGSKKSELLSDFQILKKYMVLAN